MKQSRRLDILKFDGIEMTPQGFLKFPVYAGRVGIQIYMDKSGQVIKEHRPPEEVFSNETMESLKGVPVTNDHPATMVSPENSKELMIGFGSDTVSIVNRDGSEAGFVTNGNYPNAKFQKTFVTITDTEAIKDIQAGKLEVSLGYDVKLDKTAGEYEGQSYDTIQREIIINHLALVDRGRAGHEVRLKTDRYDAVMLNEHEINKINNDNKTEGDMPKIKIGDAEFEVEKDLKDAYEKDMKEMKDNFAEMKKGKDEAEEEAKKEADEKEEELKDAKEEKEEAEKKADSLQAKLDAASEKEVKIDADTISKLVKERKDLEDNAAKILSEEDMVKLDRASEVEIKKAVINADSRNDVDFEGKSEVYISARYDAVVERLDVSENANKKVSENFKNDKKEVTTVEEKRTESMRNDSEAWNKPLGKTVNK